jgi:hypothetical protein
LSIFSQVTETKRIVEAEACYATGNQLCSFLTPAETTARVDLRSYGDLLSGRQIIVICKLR